MSTRDEIILDLAKTIEGPREKVPDGSPYSLEYLQDHVWSGFTHSQQRAKLHIAGKVYDRLVERWGVKFP